MIDYNQQAIRANNNNEAEQLYTKLCDSYYKAYPYNTKDIGEDMALVEEVICGYWKPRYLMDRKTCCAYEFMDDNETLRTVSQDDIDWESLKALPEKAKKRAEELCFHFPSFVNTFKNGTALVSWQLNPDGEYYMDEDGFGMTGDREVEIYGFIDRKGHVLVKFQRADNSDSFKALRTEAERLAVGRD